jgi:multidrug efflux pump subunit AcrA (membrane-fusion protein)
MKGLLSGIAIGALMMGGVWTAAAQNERAMHPRIAAAIASLKDAEAYMREAPHDFGGHREAALKASEAAIRQLNFALAYRDVRDHR